jgi:hypothetical protein
LGYDWRTHKTSFSPASWPCGFDFKFFANSKFIALDTEALTGLLTGGETIDFQPIMGI